ncbi:MAG: hypothetical protein NTZ14_06975 [Hyphomicrobiales bacterium]|nr:hypothetical protein [Hyphomicrobiales bacterium]
MPPKTSLNAKNLEALGAKRLAALLIEVSSGHAAAKRRLRLELAGEDSPAEVARTIARRLATIAKSRGFVDWQNRKGLVEDLESQRRAITATVQTAEPDLALDLMWRFLALADSIFARCDDSSGTVIGIFHKAVAELGVIAATARPDAGKLADQVFAARLGNGYGQYDGLIAALSPALGADGLEHLKQRLIAHGAEKKPQLAKADRRIVAYGSGGPVYQDEIENQSRGNTVRLALMEIADAQGDVDGFMAQYDARARKVPAIAAKISRRLLAAGRVEDAWQTIEAAEHPRRRGDLEELGWRDFAWDDARIDVLDAMGRKDDAQAARWSCFEQFLSAAHLRAHLKGLPDFDDISAEERALDLVMAHGNLHHALHFLVSWPKLEGAAKLVEHRASELDGDRYEILSPAAGALAGKHPLAATLVLRAMIDFTLTTARASRYKHAARHLAECGSLAKMIASFGTHESHEAYLARIRRENDRKSGFWGLVR